MNKKITEIEDFFEELKNQPKPNIFKRIYLWWKHEGSFYHLEFIQGIKNLWFWLPVIWKDRNYDRYFIFETLKQKLKFQANYLKEKDSYVNCLYDVSRMNLCISLIDKIQNETYSLESMDYGKIRTWFTPYEKNPDYHEYHSEVVEDNYEEFFKKYPIIYKKVLNGEGIFSINDTNPAERNRKIATNIAIINQKRAQDLLFKLLNTHILNWWN